MHGCWDKVVGGWYSILVYIYVIYYLQLKTVRLNKLFYQTTTGLHQGLSILVPQRTM